MLLDLEIVMTDPAFQKKGLATILLQHGFDLADALDYDCYLDAENKAMALYAKAGYTARMDVEMHSVLIPMMRPRKSQRPSSHAIE
jgi:GNAT superfamily N-acetyltransferase